MRRMSVHSSNTKGKVDKIYKTENASFLLYIFFIIPTDSDEKAKGKK